MDLKKSLAVGVAVFSLMMTDRFVWAQQSDAAAIPVRAVLGETLTFTVHDPLSFDLVPSPTDTRTAQGTLAVATNAGGGYLISVVIDRQLTEEGDLSPDVIPAWVGTVDQPTSWPAEATGFGFSLDDGNTYAGFPTTEMIVHAGEQTNSLVLPIDYRVTADSSLDAGAYSATITYTAVATF